MKKLLMFLCCVFIAAPAFADCQPTNKCTNNIFGMFDKTDDILDAEDLKTRSEKGGTKEVASCYWCGANRGDSACKNGDIVIGLVNSQWRARRCYEGTGMSDHWGDYNIPECDNSIVLEKIGEYDEQYDLYSAKDTTFDTIRQNLPNVTVRVGSTFCKKLKTEEVKEKRPCDGIAHGETKIEKCPAEIPNGNQCSKTCNDGTWSGWTLVSCKSGFRNKNGKCEKIVNNNGGGNNNGNNGNGGGNSGNIGNNNGDSGNVNIGDDVIVVAPGGQPPFSCPELTPSDWRTAYASCADVIAAYEALEEYCANEPTKNEFNSKLNALVSLRNACSDKQRRITESTAKISGLGDKLKDIMSAKLSVWKTAEGNFNGARLASDSIAGVVLGTAGGLITSTVVKKNQVKTGFEDVNCAVGGQNVAGWGDEFTVGIR